MLEGEFWSVLPSAAAMASERMSATSEVVVVCVGAPSSLSLSLVFAVFAVFHYLRVLGFWFSLAVLYFPLLCLLLLFAV